MGTELARHTHLGDIGIELHSRDKGVEVLGTLTLQQEGEEEVGVAQKEGKGSCPLRTLCNKDKKEKKRRRKKRRMGTQQIQE